MDEVRIPPAGDGFYAAARANAKRRDQLQETDLLTALREEQARIGRGLTDSERDRFARSFYAAEYRQDLRRAMAQAVEDSEEE